MVGTVPVVNVLTKAAVVNPYAKKKPEKTAWNNCWAQTTPKNDP
jgi:hypothetical protein